MLNKGNISYWERKSFVDEIDYVIVGAGIVGYSCALHLRKRFPQSKIVIIERGVLPAGASTKNAGFACFGSATEIYDDLQNFDEGTVWDTVAMRWEGLHYLRSLVGDENLKLELRGSWDLTTPDQAELFTAVSGHLSYFNQKIKEITGIDNVYSVDNDTNRKFGFEGISGSFQNRLEGQIDTASMNSRFLELIYANGIKVLNGVTINSIHSSDNEVVLSSDFGEFKCSKTFVCTNGFAAQFFPDLDLNPARAQVLVTKPLKNLPFEGTFHFDRGYYYFRNIDGRVLLGGGRNLDFEGETTTEIATTPFIIGRLEKLLKEIILPGTEFEIEHTWAGIMGVGNTKRPIIQEIEPNILCGVRMGGMGVAIGSLVGKELSEMI